VSEAHISEKALDDLDEIWDYIARDSQAAADRHIARLREKCQVLADNPGFGTRRDDLRPGMRSFPVGSYLILFQRAADGIDVIRVIHGYRDIPKQFEHS